MIHMFKHFTHLKHDNEVLIKDTVSEMGLKKGTWLPQKWRMYMFETMVYVWPWLRYTLLYSSKYALQLRKIQDNTTQYNFKIQSQNIEHMKRTEDNNGHYIN